MPNSINNRNLYAGFVKVPNKLLDNLSQYTRFHHLKIILWLLYKTSDIKNEIMDACGIANLTSFKNNILYSMNNGFISHNKENNVFSINRQKFQILDKKAGYYPSLRFTMIPNKFFSLDLSVIESMAELKILLYIFRNTLGWHKSGLKFSMNSLAVKLNMSKTTVSNGVEANVGAKRIYIVKNGNAHSKGTTYALSMGQNLEIMEPQNEEDIIETKKNVNEAIDFDYTIDGTGYHYPKSRRGDKSWRKIPVDGLTFQHVLDAWVEMCFVKKHGSQPYRRLDWLKYNSVIRSIKGRGFTPSQFKWALGYSINVVMKEAHREARDLPFHLIGDYIGLAPKN